MFQAYQYMKMLIPEKCCQKYRVDSECVVVTNLENKMVFLNSTAGDIFMHCDGKSTIQEIAEAVLQEYEVEEKKIQEDIVTAIRDFQWNEIIALRHSTTSQTTPNDTT